MRLILYYLFEVRESNRGIWRKYIPSVDRIIRFTYKNEPKTLRKLTARLEERLALYQETDPDWDGFCGDAEARAVTLKVTWDIVAKARSDRDEGIPAIWFSNLVKEDSRDDQALFNYFRQSRVQDGANDQGQR